MWTYYAPGQSAAAVALVFCQTLSPPADPGPVSVSWDDDRRYGKICFGMFSANGVRYDMARRENGWWSVEPSEEP